VPRVDPNDIMRAKELVLNDSPPDIVIKKLEATMSAIKFEPGDLLILRLHENTPYDAIVQLSRCLSTVISDMQVKITGVILPCDVYPERIPYEKAKGLLKHIVDKHESKPLRNVKPQREDEDNAPEDPPTRRR
jgi:hypothetical protein